MEQINEKDFLTVDQVAEMFQVTPQSIYQKISGGTIPTHPWFGKPRIPREAVMNWDISTKDTFAERKLRQEIEQKDELIRSLKNTIRSIVKTGLEVSL